MAQHGTRPGRVPPGRTLAAALDASPTLAQLLAGHRRAQACFEVIRLLLPAALLTQVRPGPIEEKAWTLLARSGGAAAKLRQCLPSLVEAVQAAGYEIDEIRVKVSPPTD
jgi:Dna[CI] antecedent, DciA